MKPDNAMFDLHMKQADFQIGIDEGMWGIANENSCYSEWPYIYIWIKAKEKPNSPERYFFRFDLSNYPSSAPTACPWDFEGKCRLESNKWPRGSRFVSNTFNPTWNQTALYAPCDRIAMAGHEGWKDQFPELWWQASFKITVYLNFLFRLLNSSDYARQ
jgi:hypothetical protein